MALLIGSLFTVSVSLIALSTHPDTSPLSIRKEGFMRKLLDRFRRWRSDVILAGTTFCERCSQVCTTACRRDALLDKYHQASSGPGPHRF